MVKKDLVKKISEATGVDRYIVSGILESTKEELVKSLISGDSIYLRGFGTFFIKKRAPKRGRNISRGTVVDIPAHKEPVLRFCKEVKEAVR